MVILIHFFIFLVSLTLLIFSSDKFISGAVSFAASMGISPFITGVVIVGIGTSLPELVSSIIAMTEGVPEIIPGNVIGSNIANILLVLGLGAVSGKEISIHHDIFRKDLPVLLMSTVFLFFIIQNGEISLIESIILLIFMFVYFTVKDGRKTKETQSDKKRVSLKTFLLMTIPPFGIFFGAKHTVGSVVQLGTIIGINPEIIALSAVSIGTSLPEIIVTIQAARRGQGEIAIGNITGSNIFNILGVIGIPGLLGTIIIPVGIIEFSMPFLLGSTLIYMFIVIDKKVLLIEGFFLLCFYIYFLLKIFRIIF